MKKEAVLVAMSGGVDSAACAMEVLAMGYDAVGVTMRLHEPYAEVSCGAANDLADARAISDALGMAHHALDLADAFQNEVVEPFVCSYDRGYTPNPCILCNRCMKIGRLLALADTLDCHKLATGHYARVEFDADRGRYLLKKALCKEKDQTYVLYFLSQEALSRLLLPLGNVHSKDEVRAAVTKRGLPVGQKKESQDICFIPDGNYAAFIERTLGKQYPEGDFLDVDGRVLGRHRGIHRYTIGQRKGLGIALGEPMYVKSKSVVENTVTLARDTELYVTSCTVREVNWIAIDPPTAPIRATVQTRYRAREIAATITPIEKGRVQVDFDCGVRAVTPGQAAVLYDGDVVLGGGTIE